MISHVYDRKVDERAGHDIGGSSTHIRRLAAGGCPGAGATRKLCIAGDTDYHHKASTGHRLYGRLTGKTVWEHSYYIIVPRAQHT